MHFHSDSYHCNFRATLELRHARDITEKIMENVVNEAIPAKYLDDKTTIHINPCGQFVCGGPMSDAGFTGRKIIVDTHGKWGAHGGGAFSSKDYTKVDRSGAYAASWTSQSLVKSRLCKRCLIQVSYTIGIAELISISIFDYGTSIKTQEE
ncbi:S-adenosylmethionine synthase [Blattella germanica]|nr:S-adenosylmethionine synthase [Blattella germanica]